MSRILIQAAAKVAEVAAGTEARLASPVTKLATEAAEVLNGGKATAGAIAEGSSKLPLEQVGSKLANEGVAALSGAEAAGGKTLTLSKGIKPNSEAPEAFSVRTRNGSSVDVEVRRVPRFRDQIPRAAGQPAGRGFEEMSELETNQYLNNLLKSQDRIIAHNLKVAERDPDSIGKFAQIGIFKPLQARFDALKTNPNVRLMSIADGSALDAAGADALMVNFKNKHMWLADVKPMPYIDRNTGKLTERGIIPTARSNSLIEYDSSLFRKTQNRWTVNEHSTDFKKFIDQSAQRLVGLSENPSLFSLYKTPPPTFMPGNPADAFTGVSRFQKALLTNGNDHLKEYGRMLNGTLNYLRSPEASYKFSKLGSF